MANTMFRLENALRRRQRQEAIKNVLEILGAVVLAAAAIYLWWR